MNCISAQVNKTLRMVLCGGVATVFAAGSVLAQDITLHGATQFDDNHAFNKTLLKFEELVKDCYGKPIEFVLHRNSELGLEKDYFAYMNQGISVDYAVVAPSHMSTFSKMATVQAQRASSQRATSLV